MVCELILHGEVHHLHVGRLEIVLASIQIETLTAVDGRVSKVDGGERLFHRRRVSIVKQQWMLRIRAGEGRGIDEGIVGAQRSAVAEVAQGSIGYPVSAADNQRGCNTERKPQPGSEVHFLSVSQSETRNAVNSDIAACQQSVERRRPRHGTTLIGDVVDTGVAVAAGRDKVSLSSIYFGIRREVVPAKAKVQGKVRSSLPVILEIRPMYQR